VRGEPERNAMRGWRVSISAALAAFAMPWAAGAASDEAVLKRLQELEDKVQYMSDLEQEVQLLKRRVEVEEEAAAARGPAPIIGAGPDGFFLSSSDRKWILRLRGYYQADARFYPGDGEDTATDTFLFRRVRPIFEGTLAEWIDFRLMPDFANSQLSLQDAYANLRPFGPLGQLQVGKFKAPFGLERLQSATALVFAERSLPTNLAPNRDIGAMFWGNWNSGMLEYYLAVMNGVPDGSSADQDTNDAKDIVARVFARPFQDTTIEALQGLGIGMAINWGNENGTPANYRTAGQLTFFSWAPNTSLEEDRLRFSPQMTYYWGPFGLMGEYIQSRFTVGRSRTFEDDVDVQSWQVTASWVLTGENASFNGVVPREPFSPRGSGFGAFEVAARIGQLTIPRDVFAKGFANPQTSAREATDAGVGLNWYLNRWLKVAVDYDRTWFDGGARGSPPPRGNPVADRETEHFFVTRLQWSY
jgi:phosphate-selective porin OprO/OprP